LIQANSGGGKSWAIRKLLEATHGHVQQIVLDIEGDFGSLREKFDFIIAGKGGDIPAHPRSAEMMAHKVLELHADIIIDLYELKQHDRIRFVRLFLEAMINAPKTMWHPCIVVIDEAHIFAPEKGQAESLGAVIDLETRGRKRGYCGVLATQRLSKLHKDAAAECNNKLIGRTGLDIDLRRAADELGLGVRDYVGLRELEPGEFYAFGPAISKQVIKGRIGAVVTHHPQAGKRALVHAPAPTEKVKTALAKLMDLPREAEEDLRDREELRAKVRQLQAEVRRLETQKAVNPKELERATTRAVENFKKELRPVIHTFNKEQCIASKSLQVLGGLGTDLLTRLQPMIGEIVDVNKPHLFVSNGRRTEVMNVVFDPKHLVKRVTSKSNNGEHPALGRCERAILGFLLAKTGTPMTKVQIGAMTGYSHNSGGFNNALYRLTSLGIIERNGDKISLAEGANVTSLIGHETQHQLRDWINKLGKCERAIYALLLEAPDVEHTKAEIAQSTGYSAGSGGFNNAIYRLNTLGLIQRRGNSIQLNPDVANL